MSKPLARLVSFTFWNPDFMVDEDIPIGLLCPEGPMAYTARVSSSNQANDQYERLLTYCIHKGHWSVFEMADATIEITTSRAIAAQLLRHKSFNFQEFSQRYAEVKPDYMATAARMQDAKNRQSSLSCTDPAVLSWWELTQQATADRAFANYEEALRLGIAKEVARMLLPLCTTTRLFMKGSLRSWIHYLTSRLDPATQLEHRQVALAVHEILKEKYPVVMKAAATVYPQFNL
jgi:thymidylate synthase (FAD)